MARIDPQLGLRVKEGLLAQFKKEADTRNVSQTVLLEEILTSALSRGAAAKDIIKLEIPWRVAIHMYHHQLVAIMIIDGATRIQANQFLKDHIDKYDSQLHLWIQRAIAEDAAK